MNKIVALGLLMVTCLTSCDDGDVIVTTFNFEDANLQLCGEPGSYVFFKINSSTAESLSLQLSTTETLFLESETIDFNLDASNVVNYRTYSEAITSSYFCSNVPPTSPTVTIEYLATSGVATLITTTLLNDNDSVEEDPESMVDTDNDGLLNYYDFDDDGDNVPTAVEIGPDPDNPQNTDGDALPDYLDTDDDNDGILTRNEAGGGLDPTQMITDPTVGPDYLNPAVAVPVTVEMYREHNYSLKSSISLFLSNVVLINGEEQIIQESLDMGSIQDIVDTTITITPEFVN
ncbi:hypothetical protein [Altibacter sp.]|uniref:hypothetical protein n=1 Tax=Altibacter sp. TaxID=2024823 RepID=UPI00259076C2|nr:hypothetical protein [Altibacter sp.]MCW9036388.1 hypothetical protein [Altibacter sp.]